MNGRNKFHSKTKDKLTLFSVIATKSVEIVFEKTIDNIKEVNWYYVTPQ